VTTTPEAKRSGGMTDGETGGTTPALVLARLAAHDQALAALQVRIL
jgi:hypothetical protein